MGVAPIIRVVEIADYEALIAFWQTLQGLLLNDADSRSAIERYLNRNPKMSFLAEHDDTVVGSVIAGHDGRRGYIYHFAVSPAQRGTGLAGKLLSASCAQLRAAGINKCYGYMLQENDRIAQLAELKGWKDVSEFRLMSSWIGPEQMP